MDYRLTFFFWAKNNGQQIVTLHVYKKNDKKGGFKAGTWTESGRSRFRVRFFDGKPFEIDLHDRFERVTLSQNDAKSVRIHYIKTIRKLDPDYQQILHEYRMMQLEASKEFARGLGQIVIDKFMAHFTRKGFSLIEARDLNREGLV